jgi:hypothetical protein
LHPVKTDQSTETRPSVSPPVLALLTGMTADPKYNRVPGRRTLSPE